MDAGGSAVSSLAAFSLVLAVVIFVQNARAERPVQTRVVHRGSTEAVLVVPGFLRGVLGTEALVLADVFMDGFLACDRTNAARDITYKLPWCRSDRTAI